MSARLGPHTAITALALALALAGPAAAAVPPADAEARRTALASAEPYPYVAAGQDVRDVLTEFGKNLGLGIRVSNAVKGKAALPPSAMPPREFLDRLASDMGFLWYFDGLTLHVVGLDEAENHLLALRGVALAGLRKALDQLGLADPRYPLRGTADGRFATVVGPKPFVAAVETLLASLGGGPESPSAERPSGRPLPTVYRGRGS